MVNDKKKKILLKFPILGDVNQVAVFIHTWHEKDAHIMHVLCNCHLYIFWLFVIL